MIERTRPPRPPGRVRIIGGRWRGRHIDVVAGRDLRPTPNRVRETVFNWLAPRIAGARCLDLFAGTGALGIEALSRGAAEAVFVETDRRTAGCIEAALGRLGAEARVVHGSGLEFVHDYRGAPFDVIFVDPPFDFAVGALLTDASRCLSPAGDLYLERAAADGLPELPWGSWRKRGRAASVCYGLAARGELQCRKS